MLKLNRDGAEARIQNKVPFHVAGMKRDRQNKRIQEPEVFFHRQWQFSRSMPLSSLF